MGRRSPTRPQKEKPPHPQPQRPSAKRPLIPHPSRRTMPNPVLEKAQERASEEMTGMSFLDHLEELRRRIIFSFLSIVGGFGICWWYHEQIFALMQKPIVFAL